MYIYMRLYVYRCTFVVEADACTLEFIYTDRYIQTRLCVCTSFFLFVLQFPAKFWNIVSFCPRLHFVCIDRRSCIHLYVHTLYTYIHTYVCILKCVYVCTYINIYIYIYIHERHFVCIDRRSCIYATLYTYICTCVYVCVYIYIYIYIYMHV